MFTILKSNNKIFIDVVVSHLVLGPSNRAVLNPSGCYIETRGVRIMGLSVSISSSYHPQL